MLKAQTASSTGKIRSSLMFWITAIAASGLFAIGFFLIGLGLRMKGLMILAMFVGVTFTFAGRRYRWLPWVIVPGFMMVTTGLWVASAWSLRAYHGAPRRIFRIDDYELARFFRAHDSWNSARALEAFDRVEALQQQHPERYPEFAIAEMQLLRRILPQSFIHSPAWQQFLRQRAQRSWQSSVQPAVEASWQDIQYICSGKPQWYAIPFLAVSCFHESRDVAWILQLLSLRRPEPYPAFSPGVWNRVKDHLYQYEKSPILNEIVIRESLMFYRIARKLHMWRRIALMVAVNFKKAIPPDPFAEDGQSFKIRGCRIISEANYIYNWCEGKGERPETSL